MSQIETGRTPCRRAAQGNGERLPHQGRADQVQLPAPQRQDTRRPRTGHADIVFARVIPLGMRKAPVDDGAWHRLWLLERGVYGCETSRVKLKREPSAGYLAPNYSSSSSLLTFQATTRHQVRGERLFLLHCLKNNFIRFDLLHWI